MSSNGGGGVVSNLPPLNYSAIYTETKRVLPLFAVSEGNPRLSIVNCKYLAEFISKDSLAYPNLTDNTSIKGTAGRLSQVMNKNGWKPWGSPKSYGKGRKFVVPWDRILK